MKAILFTLLLASPLLAMPNDRIQLSHTVFTSHKDLEFVRQGRLLSVEFLDEGKSAFGKLLIYSASGQTPLVVDGSPTAIEHVIRNEFPDGVSDAFLENHLARAVLAMSTNSRTYLIDPRVIAWFETLKLEGKSQADMRDALRIVHPAVLKSGSGGWEFNYFAVDGRIYGMSCTGKANPFSVETISVEVLAGQIPPGMLVGEGQVFRDDD
jgi:hypothetical protein